MVSSGKVSSIDQDEKQLDQTNWRSIYLAGILVLSSAIQYSIFFGNMWPYLVSLDVTATESFFGIIIAAYSFSGVLCSPLFGLWADKVGSIKSPIYAGLFGQLVGNAIYILLGYVGFGAKYGFLVSRLICGIGSSCTSLFKSYGSTATTSADRARGMAIITSGFAIGIVVGPLFNACFVHLGPSGFMLLGIPVNMYTSPAIVGVIINSIGIFATKFLFVEKYVGLNNKVDIQSNLPPYDKLALGIVILTRSCQLFVLINIEVLMSPYSMMMFAFSETESINTIAIATGFFGVVELLMYGLYLLFRLDKYIKFRKNIKIGLLCLVLFQLLTFPYPFGDKVTTFNSNNSTAIAYQSNRSVERGRGCDELKFSWCKDLNQTNAWIYFIAFSVIIGLSFPIINISLNTLFSKIIGPRPQGILQGLMTSVSSIAQIIGPVLASFLYYSFGPKYAWILNIAVSLIILSLWCVFHNRLVPLKCKQNENVHTKEINNTSKT
uniref:MFS domain-containing protein n=1 Tax=Rhabditophanes sp. KR3021 TaxID=114890 RepID=A0AC35TQF1_9BILA